MEALDIILPSLTEHAVWIFVALITPLENFADCCKQMRIFRSGAHSLYIFCCIVVHIRSNNNIFTILMYFPLITLRKLADTFGASELI